MSLTVVPDLEQQVEQHSATALLGGVARRRAEADAAEVEVLRLATVWADLHPAVDDRADRCWEVPQPVPAREVTDAERVALSEYHPSLLGPDGQLTDRVVVASADGDDADDPATWAAIPAIAWDAPAAFAVANRTSTTAAKALIRDALVLRHRLPQTWREVLAGRVTAWRARRIAQMVLGAPVDVVEDIDTRLAPVAGSIGPVALANLIDAALLRLHAELRELDQITALEQRSVTLDETAMTHTGLADLTIHSDWADLKDLHTTITRIAGLLTDPAIAGRVDPLNADQIATADLDVRRAVAAGVLADPDQAADLLRLLDQSQDHSQDHSQDDGESGQPVARRRSLELVVHLTDAALIGRDPIARCEQLGPVLANLAGAWASRPDTDIHVRPVIDLNDVPTPAECWERAYQPSERLAEIVTLMHPRCVHPYCERPASACDLDHIVPWPHGPTCTHNLAPLCRHHHRLKTHAGWHYEPVDPLAGVYHWTSPHGLRLRVDHHGTHPL